MLKRIRRTIMFSALISMLIGLALLANFTAPNPTGRRYSSEMPSRDLSDMQRGFDAERILGADLGIETNNSSNAGECVCNQRYAPDKSPRANNCNVCVVYSPIVQNFNIPDFVNDRYIIESKDALTIDLRSQEQIRNFAFMAQELDRSLWLFVSYRTQTPAYITQLVEETGGQIVRYFSFPGFVDEVDNEARKLIFGSFLVLSLGFVWEYRTRKPKLRVIPSTPSPTSPKPPKDPLKDAESFATRSKEKHRIQIDIEDSRNDLK